VTLDIQHLGVRFILTLIAGALGGAVFAFFHLPAPWLSGALVGLVVLTASGVKSYLPNYLRDLGMLFAGAVTGSAITPEMIQTASRYPLSLLLLGVATALAVIAGKAVLTRGYGWEKETAYFASVPGALSAVFATAAGRNVDMLRIAAVQSLRIFILIALLPTIATRVVAEVPHGAGHLLGAPAFAAMMAASIAIALLFERLGVMAPFLLGGMVAAGAMHVSGAVVGQPPDFVAAAAMLLVGIFAGTRFSTLSASLFRSLLLPALAVFFVTAFVSAIFAIATAYIVGLPLALVLVAYAPGGLEAMVMLGLALGLDPLYVSAHHIARFVMIAAAVPFLARRASRNEPPSGDPPNA
jgi:membrane AbrB-like protein